jgi:hypothetical protein
MNNKLNNNMMVSVGGQICKIMIEGGSVILVGSAGIIRKMTIAAFTSAVVLGSIQTF